MGRISRAQLQGKPSFCPLDHPQRQNEVADAALEFVTLGTSWQVVLQDNGSAEVRSATKAPPICSGAEFAQWAHRIATGVSIAPVM